jgi:hypothetical protein
MAAHGKICPGRSEGIVSRRLDPAAVLFGCTLVIAGASGAVIATEGCTALQASNVPQATQALESCVAGQLIAGQTDPAAIAVACAAPAGADILDLVLFLAQQLEAAGKVPAGTTAKVAAARAK